MPGLTFARHVIVTSAELYCVALRALHGRIALFGMKVYDIFTKKKNIIADLNI